MYPLIKRAIHGLGTRAPDIRQVVVFTIGRLANTVTVDGAENYRKQCKTVGVGLHRYPAIKLHAK